MHEGYVKYTVWRRISNTHENSANIMSVVVTTVRWVCCGGRFSSGGGIGKIDGLCVWVEMWEMFVLISAFG